MGQDGRPYFIFSPFPEKGRTGGQAIFGGLLSEVATMATTQAKN